MSISNKNQPGLIVVSSLTGTDRAKVLSQTQKLPDSAPAKGSPGYQAFLESVKESPANIVSTIVQALQTRGGWKIESKNNYQTYLNQFNGAPFVRGASGGSGTSSNFNRESVDDTINEILITAGVPQRKLEEVATGLQLANYLEGDFEDDPKSFSLITQNLDQTDGNIRLIFTTYDCQVTYTPGKKKALINKKKPPTYSVKGTIVSSSLLMQGKAYFADNDEMFLGFGFTKVTDWLENASTPPTKKDSTIFTDN